MLVFGTHFLLYALSWPETCIFSKTRMALKTADNHFILGRRKSRIFFKTRFHFSRKFRRWTRFVAFIIMMEHGLSGNCSEWLYAHAIWWPLWWRNLILINVGLDLNTLLFLRLWFCRCDYNHKQSLFSPDTPPNFWKLVDATPVGRQPSWVVLSQCGLYTLKNIRNIQRDYDEKVRHFVCFLCYDHITGETQRHATVMFCTARSTPQQVQHWMWGKPCGHVRSLPWPERTL